MTLRGWSLATAVSGGLLLVASHLLTKVVATDQWSVVIPLTVYLFAHLVLAAAVILCLLWCLWLGRWQRDTGIALLVGLLAATPVSIFMWNYFHQTRPLTKFVLMLMWTGK